MSSAILCRDSVCVASAVVEKLPNLDPYSKSADLAMANETYCEGEWHPYFQIYHFLWRETQNKALLYFLMRLISPAVGILLIMHHKTFYCLQSLIPPLFCS